MDFFTKTDMPIWLAIVLTLIVPVISLLYKFFKRKSTRPNLTLVARRVSSFFPQGNLGYLDVRAVNTGDQPIFLDYFGCNDGKGNQLGRSLANSGAFIRLDVNEAMSVKVSCIPRGKNEFDASGWFEHEGDGRMIDFSQLWFTDSLRQRYRVPDDERLMSELHADYKEWCKATNYWQSGRNAES